MQFLKSTKLKALILTIATSAIALHAQTYRLPGEHTAEHRDLIASQENINNQIKVENTQQFLDNLFKEEEEPELDIYTEGWASKRVNPYANAVIPQTKVIDVSGFAMPHAGYVTSPYGYRRRFRRMHKGIDLKVHIGDTIRAAFDGKVRLTNFERRGYGNYVIIRHPNELETVYGHLSKFLVEPDQYVKAGDPIALGGNTGRSTGPHLHFETRFMGLPINPAAIFDFANQTVHTDTYTFDKSTYQKPRNFDPAANSAYAKIYLAEYQKAYPNGNGYKPERTSSSSRSKTYTVRKGDSLSRIASRNGVTVKQICRLNGIKTTSTLRPGQRLRLR